MMNRKHVETKLENKTKINKKCIIFDYGFFKFEGVKDLVTHIYVRLCKGMNGPFLPSFSNNCFREKFLRSFTYISTYLLYNFLGTIFLLYNKYIRP